jgi:hypothetical protein
VYHLTPIKKHCSWLDSSDKSFFITIAVFSSKQSLVPKWVKAQAYLGSVINLLIDIPKVTLGKFLLDRITQPVRSRAV